MVASYPQARAIQGYGLLELLFAVALIGILSSIAYVSYQNHNLQARRVQMMAELQTLAVEIHAQKLTQTTYSAVALSTIFPAQDWAISTHQVARTQLDQTKPTSTIAPSFDYPASGTVLYQVAITPVTNDGLYLNSAQWQLTATPHPQGLMKQDGILSIDFAGRKCYRDKCQDDGSWY